MHKKNMLINVCLIKLKLMLLHNNVVFYNRISPS